MSATKKRTKPEVVVWLYVQASFSTEVGRNLQKALRHFTTEEIIEGWKLLAAIPKERLQHMIVFDRFMND